MELIGRVTANATVNTTKDGCKVVPFSIPINDNYKTKDSDERKKVTTYFNCSYWMRKGIVKHLLFLLRTIEDSQNEKSKESNEKMQLMVKEIKEKMAKSKAK